MPRPPGRDWGGASPSGFQPPRAGLCQRRPSLSKEGDFVAHSPHLPMDDWFSTIASPSELPADVAQELHDIGFVVIAGPVAPAKLSQLAAAYDAAVSGADPADIGVGRTTTRVHDFVNRGPEFDELYLHKPILGACCSVIGRPFKLSTMLARTLNPNSPSLGLHVDYRCEPDGWPMLGFILDRKSVV